MSLPTSRRKLTLNPQTYLAFDGNDFAASAPASTQIDNVTIEGWIRWDGTPGNGHGQVLFYNGNTSTAGYGIFGEVINGTFHLESALGRGAECHVLRCIFVSRRMASCRPRPRR